MSLTSSLFAGVSGLTNLGNAMQVIGDNVSNVNTVGFKGNRYTFSDLLSQAIATQSGTAQVGRGMAMGSIDASYDQGSFESTGNTTDLSIGGDGFFIVTRSAFQMEHSTMKSNSGRRCNGHMFRHGTSKTIWALCGSIALHALHVPLPLRSLLNKTRYHLDHYVEDSS